jgi:putative phosphotransacetylase
MNRKWSEYFILVKKLMGSALTLNRSMIEKIVRDVVTERFAGQNCPIRRPGTATMPDLVVHVSARHMHLTEEHLEQLFGPGYQLTPMRPLYQEGHFAAKETVTLIGPRSRLISNLRILGPCRKHSQIELAFTDAITLGIENLPVRISGEIAGTPGGYVMGPAGMVELREGVIRAAMHVHMSPADAEQFGVKNRDVMKLRIGGPAGVTFNQVHARVDPASKLEVHLDTDEANACGLHMTDEVKLLKA